ncbi:MAG TPA: phage holin family protein [Thermoleophilia bacterium]|nr:phage holin family protein [Thermoleophilia bacterium]
MIYRILGGLSLLVGIIFLGVGFLALLPFLNNFNVTLLILAGVFFVLAWFFMAVGWQLANPPRPGSAVAREPGETGEVGRPEEAEFEPSTVELPGLDAAYDRTDAAESEPARGRPEVDDRHRGVHIKPEETFIGLGEPDPTQVEPQPESEGGHHAERRPGRVPVGRRFRKAGAALPPKEEPDR